ncbi:MAG: mechanosensitive ion channel family protein [bacterium]
MLDAVKDYFTYGMGVHVGNGILFFVGSMLIGFFIKRFLNSAIRKFISRTKTELDDAILDVILPHIKWITIIIASYLALEELTKGFTPQDKRSLQLIAYANALLYISFVWIISVIAIRLTDVFIKHAMERHAQRTSAKLNEAVLPLLHRAVVITIVLIAGITVLGQFGVNISSLLLSLGGLSVAIALAAQDTLSNMFAGFVIMLDRPFRLGDRIKLPTGEVGDVHEIGLRSTKVLDFDNNLIVSPNAELIKSKIINYSRPETAIRVMIELSVAYGTDIDKARSILLTATKGNSLILHDPIPEVFVSALTDAGCHLMLVARTNDFRKKWQAETEIREQVYYAFAAAGIQPGFPQRVIHTSPASKNVNPANT